MNKALNEDAPSKGFVKAVEDYRELLLKAQEVLDKFRAETDPATKEKVKQEYVEIIKKVKAAEAKFNTALKTEPASLDESKFVLEAYKSFNESKVKIENNTKDGEKFLVVVQTDSSLEFESFDTKDKMNKFIEALDEKSKVHYKGQYRQPAETAFLEAAYEIDPQLDRSKVTVLEFEDVDERDHPDYADAFISSATYYGIELDEKGLSILNDDVDYVHDQLMDYLN